MYPSIRIKALLLAFLIAFAFTCPGTASAGNKSGKTKKGKAPLYSWEKKRKHILDYHDMVLLYGGGSHRDHIWDAGYVEPYVTFTDENHREHWLFDSFLFIEFYNGADKMFASGYHHAPANKQDWTKLADYYFQSETSMGALDKVIAAARKRIGNPPTKRKVVIVLPEPIKPQKDWGCLSDNRPMDFANDSDRIAACKWYIDYVRAKFQEMKYKNLELAGFYWVAEEATNTRTIIRQLGSYLHSLNYSFNWIPYFRSDGYDQWKQLGFTYAYLQPNYFFDDKTPQSRLDEACQLARKYNMDMEMEFDERVSTGWGYRLENYMNAFKQHGIWSKRRLAYYQGDIALYQLSKSSKPEDRKLYYQFCKFVSGHPVR